MREVYVAGVGMIRFGRHVERDVPDLGAEAVLLALHDAGLTIRDVELLAAGCLFQANAMVGQRILQEVGQTGIPVVNTASGSETGALASMTPSMLCAPPPTAISPLRHAAVIASGAWPALPRTVNAVRPLGPCGPCGPGAPAGSWPALKSVASSEPAATWSVPTALFARSARLT